jgi:hypothetical protein
MQSASWKSPTEVVGVNAVLDGTPTRSTSMVQGASEICYRMDSDAFRGEMDRRETSCNGVHTVDQRPPLVRCCGTPMEHAEARFGTRGGRITHKSSN